MKVPRKLLERLAPFWAPVQNEWGTCEHCGWESIPSECRAVERHEPGCAWVEARQLLGDKLPATAEAARKERA